jgi:hypothetical protein
MRKLHPRRIASMLLYGIGDALSRPMLRHDWAWLYPAYSAAMRWSSSLDEDNSVWGPPTLPAPTRSASVDLD